VTAGAADASRERDRKGGGNIMNITVKSGEDARGLHQNKQNLEMT
jgi:hypothetical protein